MPTLKVFSFPSLLIGAWLISSILTIAIAKPIASTLPSSNPVEALVGSDPPISSPRALQIYPLAKRRLSGTLPGGWQYVWDEVLSFSHVPSAAKSLEELYQSIIEELDKDEMEAVLENTVTISRSVFKLVLQMQDQRLGVPLPVLRNFILRMLLRTQLGWVTKYKGQIHGPGGLVVDVALKLVGPISGSILDSAMDMYGG